MKAAPLFLANVKVINCIHHKERLWKQVNAGAHCNNLELTKSLLNSKIQSVAANGKISGAREVKHGVP